MEKDRSSVVAHREFWRLWIAAVLVAITPGVLYAASLEVTSDISLPEDFIQTYDSVVVSGGATLTIGGGSSLTVTDDFTVRTGGAVVIQGKNNMGQVDNAWVGEGVTIHAGNLTIESGSQITADGQGYVSGKGPGNTNAYGASHGGRGGEGTQTVYGSTDRPVDLGSACDVGWNSWAAGGGAIKLVVDDTLQLDGKVTANGMGTPNYSGGSGGSIWVDTDILSGSGLFQADGGAEDTTVRSSAGGRMAIYYNQASEFTGFATASVTPGLASFASGEAGTLVFIDKTVDGWAVRVTQRLELLPDSDTTFGTLTLEDGAELILGGGSALQVTGLLRIKGDSTLLAQGKNNTDRVDGAWVGEGVTIRAGNLTIDSGSLITADGQGYVSGKGPGNTNAYGASHGGRGGEGTQTVYGSIYQPVDLGSACDVGWNNWAAGGGAIKLVVDDTLQLDGKVTANGMGTTGYSGGSGGSIWVDTDILSGSGLFQADGGAEDTTERSSGGGRIAVFYRNASGFTGFATASVAPGLASFASGEAGTLVFIDKEVDGWAVRVTQRLELLPDSDTTFGTLTLENGAELVLGGGSTLQVTGLFSVGGNSTVSAQGKNNTDKVDGAWVGEGVTIHAGNLAVESGSLITADGQGYISDMGPGNSNAYGAAYGGRGGGGTASVYGSIYQPVNLGSACDVGWNNWAAGGGAIKLVVDDTLELDGKVTANGMGTTDYSGGSGGAIWVDTDVLRGTGLFQADSGPIGPLARSSAGGRIAIYYNQASEFAGFLSSSVSPSEATVASGEPGTLIFADKTVEGWSVRVAERLELLQDSETEFGALILEDEAELVLGGGSQLHVAGTFTITGESTVVAQGKNRSDRVGGAWIGRGVSIRTGELILDADSKITADGQGYVSDRGPGNSNAYGAAHGGLGGGGTAPVYGSIDQPVDLGSACDVGWNSWATGGGAIKLIVDNTLQLGGTISADGMGTTNYAGGSGGSIWLDVGSVSGEGIISAGGFAGDIRGSGGGRIAYYFRGPDLLDTGQITVSGGIPGGEGTTYPGGDGTIVRRNIPKVVVDQPSKVYLHDDESISWSTFSINRGTTVADLTLSSEEQSFRMVEGAPLDEDLVWDTRPLADGWYELRLTARGPGGSIPDDNSLQVCLLNDANWRSGIVTGNETWSADIVHVVDGSLVIANGASLSIEAGAIVKFVPGAGIDVADGGTLEILAETDRNAVLSTIDDDSIGGDTNLDGSRSLPMPGSWNGITVAADASVSIPATTELRYLVQMHSGALAASGEVWPGNQLHHVTGDVTVPSGSSLTIMEGAVVKFAPNTKLTVSAGGSLEVDGTLVSPVIFTSEADDSVGGDTNSDGDTTSAMAGDWLGLSLDGDSSLTHAYVLNAGGSVSGSWSQSAAIHTGGNAEISLTNCMVRDSFFDGILVSSSDVTILGSVVSRSDRGINAFGGGDLMVVNTTVDDCRLGLFGHGGVITAVNCVVSNSAGVGIHADQPERMHISYTNVWSPDEGAALYGGIQDQTGSNGNISADPQYWDRATDDFRPGFGSPLIDAADGAVAPPEDFYGMARFDDPRTANTGTGTAADLGAFEFVETAASDLDLIVIAVEGPESVLAGSGETVRWTVRNLGPVPIRGPWRDRISLVPSAGGENTGLFVIDATVADGVTLGAGQSATFSKLVEVPAGVEGRYAWAVTTNARGDIFEGQNRGNNYLRAPVSTDLSVPELLVGELRTGSFTATGQAAAYKIQPPVGADIAISLDRSGDGGWTRLLASEEAMPSLAEAELLSAQWNNADASLAITGATGATYYIVAVPVHLPSSPLGYTLSATEVAFELDAVGIASGSNRGSVTLPILGSGLTADAEVSLVSGGATVTAGETVLVDSLHLYATFNLLGAETGLYNVAVRQDGVTMELESAFRVTDATPGKLRTAILMPEFVRTGREFTAWVEYENTGGTDLIMPMVGLSGSRNQEMRLEGQRNPVTKMIFLGLAPEGLPWILSPGQRGRVPVLITAMSGHNRIITHPLTAESTDAVDWNQVKETVRPGNPVADWDAAWEMMVVDYGNTAGGFVRWARDAIELWQGRTGRLSPNPTAALKYFITEKALGLRARLEGQVQLAGTGQALGGVNVALYDDDGALEDIAVSTRDGFVRFMEAGAGTFDLVFDGYLPPENLEPVVLVADVKAGPITWTLGGGAKLRGSVLLPVSVDPEELLVSVLGTDGTLDVSGLDELGRYQFRGLLSGNYTVTFSGKGFVSESVDGVALEEGQITQGPVFSARAGGAVSGMVVRASDDEPIEGARVIANDGNGNGGATESAADGTFTIEDLASGTYRVAAFADTYASSAISDATVVSGSTLTGVDLSLEAGASVSGTVTSIAIPVPDIFVALTDSDGVTREIQTGSDGSYSFADLPADDWTLSVVTGLFADHSEVITLATGEQKTLNVALAKLAYLSGTVIDGTSLVSGVQARLTGPDGTEEIVYFDPDGRLDLGLEDPGEYAISLLDGSQRQVFTVVDENSTPIISFELASGSLEGSVLAADAETPIVWAEIVLIQADQPILTTRSNGAGDYRFPNVAPGTYSTEFASSEAFFSGFDGVIVEEGEATMLSPALAGSSTLAVELVRDGQPIVSGGLVVLDKIGLESGNSTSRSVLFEAGESVEFEGLCPDEYRLHAVTEGANSGFIYVTVDAGENFYQLPVHPSAGLSGTVRDGDGNGIAAIQVAVYLPANPDDVWKAHTEADGYFQISALLPGTYVVVIAPSIYTPGDDLLKPVVRTGVVLSEGEITRIHSVMSQSGGWISGTVVSADGSIPLNGWVILRNSDGVALATAEMGSDGTYVFPEVPPGNYTVSTTNSGFASEPRSLVFGGSEILGFDLTPIWVAGFLRFESESELETGFAKPQGWGSDAVGWLNSFKSSLWEALRDLLNDPPDFPALLKPIIWGKRCDCPEAKAKWNEALRWQDKAQKKLESWNKQWEGNQLVMWSQIGELGVNLLQFAASSLEVAKDAPSILNDLKKSRSGFNELLENAASDGYDNIDNFNKLVIKVDKLDQLIAKWEKFGPIGELVYGSAGSAVDWQGKGVTGTIYSLYEFITNPAKKLGTREGTLALLNNVNGLIGDLSSMTGLVNDLVALAGGNIKNNPRLKKLGKITDVVKMLEKSATAIQSSLMALEAENTSADQYYEALRNRDNARDEAIRLHKECLEKCCDPKYEECCPEGEDCDNPPKEPNPKDGPSGDTNGIGSYDPNEKLTTGAGIGGFITPESAIIYTINFENVSSATAAAQVVMVTDPLPDKLDWSTVELLSVGFNGETLVAPMSGLQTWTTRATVESDPNPVEVLFVFDPDTGLVELVIRSVDAITGELPDDPFAGFLPPNDDTGRGEGFVSFLVKPVSGLVDGTQILNTAEIVFDVNEPIVTNESVNTIDSKAPTALVVPLSERSGESFTVSWAGDDSGGAGVSFYDVYVSIDGGAWNPWMMGTEETSGRFEGERGSTYAFYVHATDSLGYANPVAPMAQAQTIAGVSFLINISNRGGVGTGANIMIPGFVLNGTGTKKVLVRAVGPTLGGFGVKGVLEDPQLKVYSGQDEIESNDNWGDSSNAAELAAAAARVGAFPMESTSGDAATLLDLDPGSYTVKVSGVADGTGVALVEIYDADDTDDPTVKIVNISNRGEVGVAAAIMIPGFVVGGESPKTVLIRGVGPKLAGFGVQGVLENPTLTVFSGSDPVVTNDDWGDAINATELAAAAATVGAFALDVGSQDAAVLVTLIPGAYTVKVSGVGNTTGVALVEIYEVQD